MKIQTIVLKHAFFIQCKNTQCYPHHHKTKGIYCTGMWQNPDFETNYTVLIIVPVFGFKHLDATAGLSIEAGH